MLSTSHQQAIIGYLRESPLFTDGETKEYIQRLEQGEWSDELRAGISNLVRMKIGEIDQQIEGNRAQIDRLTSQIAQQEGPVNEACMRILSDHERDTGALLAAYRRDNNALAATADAALKKAATDSDAAEADAIRQSLLKKPGEGKKAA